jgi:hypothetical protein
MLGSYLWCHDGSPTIWCVFDICVVCRRLGISYPTESAQVMSTRQRTEALLDFKPAFTRDGALSILRYNITNSWSGDGLLRDSDASFSTCLHQLVPQRSSARGLQTSPSANSVWNSGES